MHTPNQGRARAEVSHEPFELWRGDCAQCVKPLQCPGCGDGHKAALDPSKHQENHVCSHFFAPSTSCCGFAVGKVWGQHIHPQAWESCSDLWGKFTPMVQVQLQESSTQRVNRAFLPLVSPFWLWWLLPFKARHCSCCDPYLPWFACAPCSWILARVSLLLES